MSKLWHISDIHLSFKADGKVQKPMELRKWSQGSSNYVDYLDRIAKFGSTVISNNDFVAITGDLTHDMKHSDAVHSIRWFRQNVNGIFVMNKGNHDVYINFGALRLDDIGKNVFLVDEGEIITIGPYTFGCYSDHNNKSSKVEVNKYLDMAKCIGEQAKAKGTKGIMLSHYPVDENLAKSIAKMGVKAYLSGHIHCTQGSAPGGNDWSWYDIAAKPTDNKDIDGCFFSTGTTDVLIQTQDGQIFKEIKALKTGGLTNRSSGNSHRSKAGNAFKCHDKFLTKFEADDPFNPGNTIAGFMCRAKGTMHGSLYITHVNNAEIEPELVYGTPKLAYPYKDNTEEYMELPNARYYTLDEKWNGTNILFFKYHDSAGNLHITAKTKGAPILRDGEFGNFFSLTCEALKWKTGQAIMSDLPPLLMNLLYDSYQSISFELCGRKEPHLVKYDFDIDLKPLFYTRINGRIEPYTYGNHKEFVDSTNVVTVCADAQKFDTELNTMYRSSLNLPHKYEYEHFAVEGKVLYLLDDDGICINRTLYKVKARDVEEVHWQTFDGTIQGRVREALNKLGRDELEPTESNIREELDMGPKEWDKFGRAIMAYAGANPGKDERRVLILVGLPGSGKSSIARQLESCGWVRINQDELGSRNKCKELMEKALVENKKVVIDRCNFDVRQRKSWIDLATKYGVTNVQALTINTDPDVCKDRIVSRENHPTVAPVEASKAIVDNFNKMMVPATHEEGFSYLMEFSGEGSTDELINEIIHE